MSAKSVKGPGGKSSNPATNLIAGGGAGMMEALACHPLDTIKVRMQLSRRARAPGVKPRGFVATGVQIVKRETFLGLYKGLGAVLSGIIPKMAIRFTAYEQYKRLLAKEDGTVTGRGTFLAGLGAGVTEAVAVVTPMEVVKIRLQSQMHSLADPLDAVKYRSAPHAIFTMLREEGVASLYAGVSLTALRQGTNQACNFLVYSELRQFAQNLQSEHGDAELPGWQTAGIGLISGAVGPFSNAPIDTIKTRLQKTPRGEGESNLKRIATIAGEMWKTEGVRAFWKGITPRVMRVAPGQAVTFTVYEFLKTKLENSNLAIVGGKYEE
ncbi:MAG: hypothetical protein Q9227_004348 [Pyrenula ochraceoflavens]